MRNSIFRLFFHTKQNICNFTTAMTDYACFIRPKPPVVYKISQKEGGPLCQDNKVFSDIPISGNRNYHRFYKITANLTYEAATKTHSYRPV